MNTQINQHRPANFFAACLPGFSSHVNTVMKQHSGYLTIEGLNLFLRNTVNKHLLSIGTVMEDVCFDKARSVSRKHLRKFVEILEHIHERLPLESCEVAIDSGGFDMIQQGRLPSRLFLDYIKFYHEFLAGYPNLFTWAFHLDLAPGYSHCPFRDETEMSNFNYTSYAASEQLPPNVRSRMIYIHHFRTPAILRVWRRMLFQERLADQFTNFSTGGLATSPEMTQLPCIAYVIPLVDILHYAKLERGLSEFRFHILGDSDWKALLVHAILEKHIQAAQGLNVTLTYDSSNLFKTVALGRYTFAFDEEVERISLRSDSLHKEYPGKGTGEHLFYETVNNAVVPHGMRPLSKDTDPLYVGGSLTPLAYTYAFLAQLAMFQDVERHCKQEAERLYPIYAAGEVKDFERRVAVSLSRLHSGFTSKNIPPYAHRLVESLRILEQLDLDLVEKLVGRMPEEKAFQIDDLGFMTF